MRQLALVVLAVIPIVFHDARVDAAASRYRAAIDIGSSSIKLLIVDRSGRVVVDEKVGAGLGK